MAGAGDAAPGGGAGNGGATSTGGTGGGFLLPTGGNGGAPGPVSCDGFLVRAQELAGSDGCGFEVPTIPDEPLDPNRINLQIQYPDRPLPEIVPRVRAPAECADNDGVGWFFDSPVDPGAIFICEASCAEL